VLGDDHPNFLPVGELQVVAVGIGASADVSS